MSHKAQRRSGSGEIGLAVTKHDGVQVDAILIDQAKFGEAVRQVRASNFDLPVALGLQLADSALEIILNKLGVGTDRLQRARDDPFGLVPPRRREGAFLRIPFRMIVIPVTHEFIHLATVHTASLPLNLLDEVAEERGAWRKRHMVDVPVQRLIHSEHEPSSHTTSFPRSSVRDWVPTTESQFHTGNVAVSHVSHKLAATGGHREDEPPAAHATSTSAGSSAATSPGLARSVAARSPRSFSVRWLTDQVA